MMAEEEWDIKDGLPGNPPPLPPHRVRGFCDRAYRTDDIVAHAREEHGIDINPLATETYLPRAADIVEWMQLTERCCLGVSAFRLSETSGQFCFLSVEFIDALVKRLKQFDADRPILELFAGTGLLSHWLMKRGINIISTDWNVSDKNTYTKKAALPHVMQMDALAAVRLFHPHTVLASWVPYSDPIGFRAFKQVRNFIWIGEGEGGCCGTENIWKQPFEDWDELWRVSICRTDSTISFNYRDPLMRHQQVGCFTNKEFRAKNPEFFGRVIATTKSIALLVDSPDSELARFRREQETGNYRKLDNGTWRCTRCQKVRNSERSIQKHFADKHGLKKLRRITRDLQRYTQQNPDVTPFKAPSFKRHRREKGLVPK
jgi:hypothetical protein